MKIQEQDLYHGAALTQIVEHKSFTALNRASSKYGHYIVNADRHVFVKYRKTSRSPWQHTFSAEEVKALAKAIESSDKVWLCLVCGNQTICALGKAEIQTVLDLSANNQQWVRVEVPAGGSCSVSGSHGSLKRKVPHYSFPDKVMV
jgi:hypothetical protein